MVMLSWEPIAFYVICGIVAAGFILAVLWVIESFEPKATKLFSLTVKAKDTATLKVELEKLMTRRRLDYQLRTSAPEELTYDVHFPIGRKTDHLSEQILSLAADASVQWEEKKEKK